MYVINSNFLKEFEKQKFFHLHMTRAEHSTAVCAMR